jgi:hypothetical protein
MEIIVLKRPSSEINLSERPVDRPLLQEEERRYSAEFIHPLSCERPFKIQLHLFGALGTDKMIAMSDIKFIAP